MTSLFNLTTTIPSVQGTQAIQPTPQPNTPSNNIFIYGHRIAATSSQTNGLPVLNPQAGFPFYEFYKTYQLPTQFNNNALGMLSYFQSCGFSVGYGYSATQTFIGASYVDVTTLAASNQAILYYSTTNLITPLVGTTISGTFNDTTASITGTFVSAAIGSFSANSTTYPAKMILQATGFASITASDTIAVSFTDSSQLVPNPATTELFLMHLYSCIEASLIPENSNSTLGTPNIYFSVMPSLAVSGNFGPTSSAETLSVPTAETSTTITFALPSLNANLIPLSALGNTTISQATSLAVGTVVSSVINGSNLVVTLSNITGTFDTTHVCTLHLDPTQTIFTFQQAYFANKNISLAHLPLIFSVNSNTDITTTYAPIFNYVAALNLPATSQNGQAVCQVVIGNTSIAPNLAATTLATAVNNYQIEPVYYPYQPIIGELPLSVGQLTSAYCMVVGSNVAPLNPQAGVVMNGIPVAQDPNKYLSTTIGSIADQVQMIGWNAISVNGNGQAFVINPRTGMTTLPNIPTPATEFLLEYVWQTVDYLRKGVTAICQNIGLGQVRQTPKVLATLKSNIISFMLDMQTQGMLLNVIPNESFIVIVQDPTNPLGVDVNIPCQIVPGLEQIYYTINIFSSTVTLATSA